MGTLPEAKQILAKYYFNRLPEHDRYGCTAVVSDYATKFEEYENLVSKSGRRARQLRTFLPPLYHFVRDFSLVSKKKPV